MSPAWDALKSSGILSCETRPAWTSWMPTGPAQSPASRKGRSQLQALSQEPLEKHLPSD